MSTISHDRVLLPGDTPERGPLLLWMIFTGLSVFAAILLWHYGFIRLMVVSDRTYISSLIGVLYVDHLRPLFLANAVHCTRGRGRAALP